MDPRDDEEGDGGRRTLYVLIGLVFAAVLYTQAVAPKLRETKDPGLQDKRLLPFFEAKDAARVTITPKDGPKLVLVREPRPPASTEKGAPEPEVKWRLEEPVKDEADHAEVRRVLGTLEWLEWAAELTGSEARRDFGEVALSVSIERLDGKSTLAFEVGAEKLGERPVRLAGDERLFLVKGDLHKNFAQEPWRFRNKQLVSIERGRMDRFVLRTPAAQAGPGVAAREITIVEHDGFWRLDGPKGEFAVKAAVDELLEGVTALRATGVEKEAPAEADLEPLGLTRPWATLVVEHPAAPPAPDAKPEEPRDAAEKVTVHLGAPVPGAEGQRYARVEGKPTVYRASVAALQTSVDRELTGWRSDVVLPVGGTAATVTRLEAKLPDGTQWGLDKKEGAWRFDDGDKPKANQAAVEALVKDLLDLTIQERLDPASDPRALGLEQGATTVAVIEETLRRELTIGAPREGKPGVHAARRPELPAPFLLAAGTLPSRLADAPLELLDRTVFAAPHFDAQSVKITDAEGKVLLAAARKKPEDGVAEWKVEGAPDATHDSFDAFMGSAFDDVKVERWLVKDSPAARAEHGLDKPMKIEVSLETFQAGKKTTVPKVLLLGKREGERIAALAEGGRAIGRIDAGFLDRLARGFAKPTLLVDFSAWDANGLKLEEGGKTLLELKKPGDNWKRGVEVLDPKEAEALVHPFARLEVTKAEKPTPARLKELGLDAPARKLTLGVKGLGGAADQSHVLLVGKRAGPREVWVMKEGGELGLLFDEPLRKLDEWLAAHPEKEAFPPAPPTEAPPAPATEPPSTEPKPPG